MNVWTRGSKGNERRESEGVKWRCEGAGVKDNRGGSAGSR